MTDESHQPRILIADDDDVMLIGVAELLRRRGIDVRTANRLCGNPCGEECPQEYDVVIFDPLIEGAGLEAASQFVKCVGARNPSTALIVVSEFIDGLEQIGAIPGPRVILHPKPVRVAALAESVQALLWRPGLIEGESR